MSIDTPPSRTPAALIALILVWLFGLLWSGWVPHDRLTWWLEVFPCFIALA